MNRNQNRNKNRRLEYRRRGQVRGTRPVDLDRGRSQDNHVGAHEEGDDFEDPRLNLTFPFILTVEQFVFVNNLLIRFKPGRSLARVLSKSPVIDALIVNAIRELKLIFPELWFFKTDYYLVEAMRLRNNRHGCYVCIDLMSDFAQYDQLVGWLQKIGKIIILTFNYEYSGQLLNEWSYIRLTKQVVKLTWNNKVSEVIDYRDLLDASFIFETNYHDESKVIVSYLITGLKMTISPPLISISPVVDKFATYLIQDREAIVQIYPSAVVWWLNFELYALPPEFIEYAVADVAFKNVDSTFIKAAFESNRRFGIRHQQLVETGVAKAHSVSKGTVGLSRPFLADFVGKISIARVQPFYNSFTNPAMTTVTARYNSYLLNTAVGSLDNFIFKTLRYSLVIIAFILITQYQAKGSMLILLLISLIITLIETYYSCRSLMVVGSTFSDFINTYLIMVWQTRYVLLILIILFIVPVVSAGTGYSLISGLLSLQLVLYFLIIAVYAMLKSDYYRVWDNVKIGIENGKKITVNQTIPYRPYDVLKAQESELELVSPESYGGYGDFKNWIKFSFREDKLRRDPPGFVEVGPTFTCAYPVVMSRSQHNQLIAITHRVLSKNEFTAIPGAWPQVDLYLRKVMALSLVDGELMPKHLMYEIHNDEGDVVQFQYKRRGFQEFLARFTPAKQLAILKAKDDVYRDQRSYVFRSFVKREKIMAVTKDDYEPFAPRNISGTSEQSKADFGTWFLNLNTCLKYSWNVTTNIWYCSGATVDMFNWWISEQLLYYKRPVFLWTDFKRYDKTQDYETIRLENQRYLDLGFGSINPFAELYCNATENPRVYGQGLVYSVAGQRQTGSLNTSSGNTTTTVGVMGSFFQKLGLKFNLVVNGDDVLVILNLTQIVKKWANMSTVLMLLKQHCNSLGLTIKTGWTTRLTEAEFLSSRFYRTISGRYVFGKMPGKVLTRIGHFLYSKRPARVWDQILKGTLESLKPAGLHVPYLRVYINLVLSHLQAVKLTEKVIKLIKFDTLYWLKGQLTKEVVDPVSFSEIYELDNEIYGTVYDNECPIDQCSVGEFQFYMDFKQSLQRYGVHFVMDSDDVESMFRRDMALHKL